MRIFLITSKLKFEPDGSPVGGSVVDLHLKAKGLAELGHDVSVVTAFSDADKIPCELPYCVFERFIKPRGLIGLQRGVYALLQEFESMADVFYIDGHMFLYGGGAYRMLGGRVSVVGFFNVRLNAWADTAGNIARPSLYRRLKKKARFFAEKFIGAPIANHLDAFIFTTPQVQKLYHDFGMGKERPNTVLPDFVATAQPTVTYGISEESIKKQQGTGPPFILFATGRMIPEKGFELIIRALALLKQREQYRLVLSGGGPQKERLEKLASELGLYPSVLFPGWVPKIKLYEFLTEAHVFIFPKWWIEYGSALLPEVLAFGIPSIVPGGGALEWLAGGSALTFSNDSVEELASRLSELMHSRALRVQLGIQGLARAKELDCQKLAVRLERILLCLCEATVYRRAVTGKRRQVSSVLH